MHMQIRRVLRLLLVLCLAWIVWSVLLRINFNYSMWVVTAAVPLILFMYNRKELDTIAKGITLGLIVFVLFQYSLRFQANLATPPEVDFVPLWIYERAVVLGLNPYDHASNMRLAHGIKLSEMVIEELNSFHPPHTMLLFAPLGLFDLHTANRIWIVFLLIVIAIDICLIWYIFERKRGITGMLFVSFLLLIPYATFMTVLFEQTIFIGFFMLLLYWINKKRTYSGIFLAMATAIKPIFGIFFIYLIATKRWKHIVSMSLCFIAMTVAAYLLLGQDTFNTYLFNNTIINNAPADYFTETINQSLLATIFRVTNASFVPSMAYFNVYFIFIGLALLLLTYIITRLRTLDDASIYGLWMMLALIVFPRTLIHYYAILVFPIFCIVKAKTPVMLPYLLIPPYYLLSQIPFQAGFISLALLYCAFLMRALLNVPDFRRTMRCKE
ncbi:MAG: DUF2029 domain-containing protein [Nanoarchaeota archaeon]|nr:DUF2029 domain-containing protein [Nanoarchaeota archaeon]